MISMPFVNELLDFEEATISINRLHEAISQRFKNDPIEYLLEDAVRRTSMAYEAMASMASSVGLQESHRLARRCTNSSLIKGRMVEEGVKFPANPNNDSECIGWFARTGKNSTIHKRQVLGALVVAGNVIFSAYTLHELSSIK